MAYVVNPLSPDGSSARAAPAASSRNMSPEIGDTDMRDPIVRAAAHPSRAILDAPARRYRLSETGNVTANGSSSIRRAKCDIAEVKHAIRLAVLDMTIRMGAIAVALLAALATQILRLTDPRKLPLAPAVKAAI